MSKFITTILLFFLYSPVHSFLILPSISNRIYGHVSSSSSKSSEPGEKSLLERTKERMQEKALMTDVQDDFPKRFKVRDFDEEAREEKQKASDAKRLGTIKSNEQKAVCPHHAF